MADKDKDGGKAEKAPRPGKGGPRLVEITDVKFV